MAFNLELLKSQSSNHDDELTVPTAELRGSLASFRVN